MVFIEGEHIYDMYVKEGTIFYENTGKMDNSVWSADHNRSNESKS